MHTFDQIAERYSALGCQITPDFATRVQREAAATRSGHGQPAAWNVDDSDLAVAHDENNGSGQHARSVGAALRPFPAHYQAHGRLYRAIVSLPLHMCDRDRPLQERRVFFDCPTAINPCARLETLLALAWNIDTAGWGEIGYIYNIYEASELIAQNDADDDTALFECQWGCEGTRHVASCDVDYFVPPLVRARLEAALARVTVCPLLEGGAA